MLLAEISSRRVNPKSAKRVSGRVVQSTLNVVYSSIEESARCYSPKTLHDLHAKIIFFCFCKITKPITLLSILDKIQKKINPLRGLV
ncbi:hypothetical protein EUGRSUZ_E02932 [Eucalyptus grandis]|uniref:Uncharacterized protein n=2 Tax=Eucalyptus grandis TaxID=71139 RepID=A0ACC3KXZ7_EUCGR|nr:hypothetical protein EUGRSUZ_E02932 [Eucalyptus grandis]